MVLNAQSSLSNKIPQYRYKTIICDIGLVFALGLAPNRYISANNVNTNGHLPKQRKDNHNDCQVLYVGENHETYRGVNQMLSALGFNVMWARDLDSARMLAKTTKMELLLCDAEINRKAHRLFNPAVIQPGASCLEMNFPTSDPSGAFFGRNLQRAKKLIAIVRNLTQVEDFELATLA